MDILMRAQAKVIKFSDDGPKHNVVEIEAGEWQEILVEIIRLRALLEGISESYMEAKHLRKAALNGILPPDE